MYSDFCAAYRVKFELPIKVEFARAFVTWAAAKKNLKSSTIKSYVSSLNIAHSISNTASPNLSSDSCVKLAIKGAKNSVDPKLFPRPSRIPMSYDLLLWDQRKPVFSFKSGKFLTKAKLNSWLASLLNDFTDENNTITGHSFRAAIPSLLAANPDVGSIKDIKLWGGWASESYKMYTKNEKEKRRIVFSKIVHCLLNSKDE